MELQKAHVHYRLHSLNDGCVGLNELRNFRARISHPRKTSAGAQVFRVLVGFQCSVSSIVVSLLSEVVACGPISHASPVQFGCSLQELSGAEGFCYHRLLLQAATATTAHR